MDLTTRYMGISLKNPLIIASSGLTGTLEGVVDCEKSGVAAVVLKSLFEEQILFRYQEKLKEVNLETAYPEAEEYISRHTQRQAVEDYLSLIGDCKKAVKIPVIASINCVSNSEWIRFAREIESAGADALELNMSILPSDTVNSCAQTEEICLDIMKEVVKQVSIPVAIKISYYFSGLAKSALRFSFSGIKGMVLFNRLYSPDIDIEEMKVISGPVFTTPADLSLPLRWIAILSERIYCDIAASTGIHDGTALVKVILAGAKAGEICSAVYQQGFGQVKTMLDFLENYMKRHNFSSVREMTGKMSMRQTENPAAFERVQFMKLFSEIE